MEDSVQVSLFMQCLVSGVALGSIYAMVAIGFNIIYNATGIINFMQGEFVMLGGMFLSHSVRQLHLPVAAGVLLAIVLVAAVGIGFERLAIRPLKEPRVLTLIIITIGGSFFFKGVAMLVWGKDVYSIPQFFGSDSTWFLGAAIKSQDFVIWGAIALVVLALSLFFGHTMTGKAMRACAYNRIAARLVGINTRTMVMLAFGLSAAIGGLAGAVMLPVTSMEYDSGSLLGLKGFCAAVAGGLGNNPAAVVAGIGLGLLESMSAGYISSHYKNAIALAILIGILVVRPSGLFGKAELSRLAEF